MQCECEVNHLAYHAPSYEEAGKWNIAPRILYSRYCVKAIDKLRVQGKEGEM